MSAGDRLLGLQWHVDNSGIPGGKVEMELGGEEVCQLGQLRSHCFR